MTEDEQVRRHYNLAVIGARTFGRSAIACGVDVDELVSEALIGLLRAVRTYEPDRGYSFQAFAMAVIRYRIIDYLRQLLGRRRNGWKPPASVELTLDPAGPDTTAAAELEDLVRYGLDRLDRRQRRVVELDMAGVTTREIAAELGVSAGTVVYDRKKARARLRDVIGGQLGAPPQAA